MIDQQDVALTPPLSPLQALAPQLLPGLLVGVRRLLLPHPLHQLGDPFLEGHLRLVAQAFQAADVGIAVADVPRPPGLPQSRGRWIGCQSWTG